MIINIVVKGGTLVYIGLQSSIHSCNLRHRHITCGYTVNTWASPTPTPHADLLCNSIPDQVELSTLTPVYSIDIDGHFT